MKKHASLILVIALVLGFAGAAMAGDITQSPAVFAGACSTGTVTVDANTSLTVEGPGTGTLTADCEVRLNDGSRFRVRGGATISGVVNYKQIAVFTVTGGKDDAEVEIEEDSTVTGREVNFSLRGNHNTVTCDDGSTLEATSGHVVLSTGNPDGDQGNTRVEDGCDVTASHDIQLLASPGDFGGIVRVLDTPTTVFATGFVEIRAGDIKVVAFVPVGDVTIENSTIESTGAATAITTGADGAAAPSAVPIRSEENIYERTDQAGSAVVDVTIGAGGTCKSEDDTVEEEDTDICSL